MVVVGCCYFFNFFYQGWDKPNFFQLMQRGVGFNANNFISMNKKGFIPFVAMCILGNTYHQE